MLALLLFFATARGASAHRLDEYLQATLLSVQPAELQASMRLIPGVSVASSVIASIDTDHNGVLSASEQQQYAQRVLNDLTLTVDRQPVTPHLIAATFPPLDQLRDGLGEIHLQFAAPIPAGGLHRRFTLANRHQNPRSVYLVNATVPVDPRIHISTQRRNPQQTLYELDYDQTGTPVPGSTWSRLGIHANAEAFVSLFRLGMRHIAEGTDHLLFLLALLLPAPLLALNSRWVPSPAIRRTLFRVLKIVTAFTVGHSLTLALAAMGFVHVPSRPIEVLIAVSILVSALHALRPIFPGREAAIAAFFGLIHGLAFASTLSNLGLGPWDRLFGILAFNLGIETMQLLVVALALPSLLLLSRTPAYPWLRISAALFAAFAACGWISERLLSISTPVDAIVNAAASHAGSLAGVLFLLSLICWRMSMRGTPLRYACREPAAPHDQTNLLVAEVSGQKLLLTGSHRSPSPSVSANR